MKITGRTQMLSQYSILNSLPVIKQLGFDGVEICVERKDWSLNNLENIPLEAIRERVAELNLIPHSFSMHQDYIYNDHIFELTQKAITMTPKLGANIFIFSGAKKKTGDRAEWNRMIERTRTMVEIAADHGVILAEEFEPGFVVGTTAELLRQFDEIPSPHLAANVDLGHVFICDPNPLQSLAQIGGKIVHCHISGMPAGQHDHLIPQEGDMDLSLYLRALRSAGFDGALALDLYKYDYEAVAKGAVDYLHQLLAQIE